MTEDPGIGSEVKSYDDLVVGLPADNLTILGLARKLADQVQRPSLSAESARDDERARVKDAVRYHPTKTERLWTTGISKHGGVETKSHLFAMADGLMTNALWLRPIGASDTVAATIVLDDKGKSATSEPVTDRLNRGEQVLAADLPFHGDAWRDDSTWLLEQMIVTTGTRPLGIEVAHLVEIARWLKQHGAPQVRIEASGMRNQAVSLVAAAIEPKLFSEVVVRQSIPSLRHLIDKPVKYHEAADLFCLDLYKTTDLDRLAPLGPSSAR